MLSSPWTSIIGVAGGVLVEIGNALLPNPDPRWHLLAVFLVALGIAAKDWNKTTPPTP